MLSFTIHHQAGRARRGTLMTPHGALETPAFLFCATKGAIKGVSITEIQALNISILLANTYHLMIQPGSALIARMGGLHAFMGWQGPLFTDSGGYQIFSLGHGSVSEEIKGKRSHRQRSLSKITEEGATFVSYTDGKRHLLTPELAITIQRDLGSDLMCVLDECTPYHVSRAYTERSMHLSHRWALRSLKAFQQDDEGRQGLYGIVQGGVYPDLRKESGAFIGSHPFFGYAIGGSLGATRQQMVEVMAMARDSLPDNRPVHLLGIGGVRDIFEGVKRGIDTFDCVSPTRLGRHGGALVAAHYWHDAAEPFHARQSIDLSKACFREDPRPIDAACPCPTCQTYSRAYLHHLIKAHELLAMSALTIHNMVYMTRLMADIRQGIEAHTLEAVERRWMISE